MRASRTHMSRQIQYSALNLTFDGRKALEAQIVNLLSRRQNPMTLKQIQQWFRATDSDFVRSVLFDMEQVRGGRTTMGSRARHNCRYVYELV